MDDETGTKMEASWKGRQAEEEELRVCEKRVQIRS